MLSLNVIFIAFLIASLTKYSLGDITLLEDERKARYLEYVGDDGEIHILDTNPQPIPKIKFLSAREDKVIYFLYTRRNRNPQIISSDNVNSFNSSNFNPNTSTIFIVHGWWGSAQSGPNPVIIKAYLDTMDVNVIAVDWSDGANDFNYYESVSKVPGVGKRLAELIKILNQATGATLDSMHLIGYSLGGHVVGNAGREVQKITRMQVARITALDPAGPLWTNNKNRLSKTDAKYVEAIHTNGGPNGFGTLKEWGSANIYPNGGVRQPGCTFQTCSHSRSYELFASTVKYNNLIGRKCTDVNSMILHNCDGEVYPLGNSDLTKSGTGVYRVETGTKEPFNVPKLLY